MIKTTISGGLASFRSGLFCGGRRARPGSSYPPAAFPTFFKAKKSLCCSQNVEGDEKPEFWLMQNSYAHLAKVAKMTTR